MLSRPRKQDTDPSRIRLWTAGVTLAGRHFDVPAEATVTSAGDVARATHFALVCSTDRPLVESAQPAIHASQLNNLANGTRVGHSQVTAVVSETRNAPVGGAVYERGFVARLVAPYFVTLKSFIEFGAAEATPEAFQRARQTLAHPRAGTCEQTLFAME